MQEEKEYEEDYVSQSHWQELGLPDPCEVDPNCLSDAEYEEWTRRQVNEIADAL